ncbi:MULTISPECIES: dipeptidase [unclassified Sphingomonas]|uniref:dipeptidase n=1 Tax=unclassified Sphingomonas TaxID=196159 RepID=UPI0025F2A8A8|nr:MULTISPECIES: dipeptidase [unclassified Sphingomonas]
MRTTLLVPLAAFALAMLPTPVSAQGAPKQPARTQDARQVHDAAIVLDTHFDTPANLGRPGWSIMDRHSRADSGDQVDYPRMVEGGIDGGFFAIFTAQGPRTPEGDREARDAALVRAVQIREMVARHPDAFRLVTTAAEARAAVAAKRRFVFMSMENGYPFEADLSLMRSFQRLGVTMMSPVHFKNDDLADSATDTPEWNGLSPKGKAFVAEANRLGILIDLSHASDDVLRQTIALSKAPVILSHSGVRAIFDHPRNVTDADLRALAAKGGVVQINAFDGYMIAQPKVPAREAAMAALMAKLPPRATMTEADRKAFLAERKAIDARWPVPRATFDNVMKHLLHAIDVAGIDHVGISGDFDGGGGVEGFDDITAFPKITAALLARGFGAADVAKVWGGNALRVLDAAQAAADPAARPAIPVTS